MLSLVKLKTRSYISEKKPCLNEKKSYTKITHSNPTTFKDQGKLSISSLLSALKSPICSIQSNVVPSFYGSHFKSCVSL